MSVAAPTLTQEFWRNRAWWRRAGKTSIAVYGSTAFGFVGTIVAARGLGPSGYGDVVLALAAVGFVTTFLDLTLEDGVVYHGFQALEARDRGGLRALLKAAFFVDAAVGITLSLLIIAAAGPIADVAGGVDPELVRIAALMTLVTCADGPTGATLLLAGRPDLRAWILAVGNCTRVVLMIVAVRLGGPALVIAAYVVGAAASSLLQGLAAWRLGWRDWSRAERTRSVRSWLRPLAHYGFFTSITSSLSSAESTVVPILLGALAGPAAAGIFAIALFPVTIMAVASAPVRLLLLPEQAKLAAAGRIAALRRSARGYTLLGFAIGVPAAVIGWFLLPWLLPRLYSTGFDGAVEPARILLIYAVSGLAVGGLMKTLPAAIGKPQLASGTIAVYTLVSITLTVLLVPSLGPTGAAIGGSAAAIVQATVWWYYANRLLRRVERRAACAHENGAARWETIEALVDSARFTQRRRCVDCGLVVTDDREATPA